MVASAPASAVPRKGRLMFMEICPYLYLSISRQSRRIPPFKREFDPARNGKVSAATAIPHRCCGIVTLDRTPFPTGASPLHANGNPHAAADAQRRQALLRIPL